MHGQALYGLMLGMEQIGVYIHELSHPFTPRVRLDLVKQKGNKLLFVMSRGERRVHIRVQTVVHHQGQIKSVRVDKQVSIDDVAHLKECVCAKLHPGLRVLNLVRLSMGEQLRMIPLASEDQYQLCTNEEDAGLCIWLDEKDRINVQGGAVLEGVRTYSPDEAEEIHARAPLRKPVFYFEDPFANKPETGEEPQRVLMPATFRVMSDVMGAFGQATMGEWSKPMPNLERMAEQIRRQSSAAAASHATSMEGKKAAFSQNPRDMSGG